MTLQWPKIVGTRPDGPTPWSTGLLVTALTAALVAVAIYAFGSALGRINPVLAALINIIAVGGAAPTIWRWRVVPIVRWTVYGAVAGVALGWIALLFSVL